MYEVKIATTEHELSEIFKLRYRVYVEEMGRSQEFADHLNKTIIEPLDETGTNVGAWLNGEIVGCVRSNIGFKSDLTKYWSLYNADLVPGFEPQSSSITTKLIVIETHRKTRLPLQLCLKAYEVGVSHLTKYNFIDCNEHLIEFFEKLGYKRYHSSITHWEYGEVFPMVCDPYDIEYFETIRSPFVNSFRKLVGSKPM